MNATEQNSAYSLELHKMLFLRSEPIAIKMIADEGEDWGMH
jgi:hypothetical protein